MPRISFSNFLNKLSPNKQDTSIVNTVASKLSQKTASNPVVVPSPTTPIDAQHEQVPRRRYICEVCTKNTEASNIYGSPKLLANHVRDNHPSEWPWQIDVPKSRNHGKQWRPSHVKTVMDVYLQIRATQDVGRRFLVTQTPYDARWVNCWESPESSKNIHIRALNAAAVTVGRSIKSVREVLNATLPTLRKKVPQQGILVEGSFDLTAYGLARINRIRDKKGLPRLGVPVLLLPNVKSNKVLQRYYAKNNPTVEVQPDTTSEHLTHEDTNNTVETDDYQGIVSTWSNLYDRLNAFIATQQQQVVDLQKQVVDFQNQDQNRIDQEESFLKEMEGQSHTIIEKDKVIASQKKRIEQLMNEPLVKEQNDLMIQIQNLTEDNALLTIANENLTKQARAHNQEKQQSAITRNLEIHNLEKKFKDAAQKLEDLKNNSE